MTNAKTITRRAWLACFLIFVGRGVLAVDYQREVRPILATHCFACHGPDDAAREADLRLDRLEDNHAIEPGDRTASEVWNRIVSSDAEIRMPPSPSHEPLTAAQIAILGEWIDSGAGYETHWAFEPPQRKQIPTSVGDLECRGPIDCFVNTKLVASQLAPSPEADRAALVRRLYLDLAGVPPTPEEADRFCEDDSPAAYERLVDRLLASPDYAERWARPWLDLARYADTNGYEKDRERTIWPYRDWVLKAISSDMPYDQFTIRQLAGDMLSNPSNDDLIATGFHRNTMLNEEGGIDPLEFRFHAMTDRVATTGIVWMGLTTGCAQCHTHKYDPITHRDYYSMMSLMNNADEIELEVDASQISSQMKILSDEVRKREQQWIDQNFSAANTNQDALQTQAAFEAWRDKLSATAADWRVIKPDQMESTMPFLKLQDDGSILASGDVTKRDVYRFQFNVSETTAKSLRKITAIRLEALPDDSLPAKGPGMAFYEGRRGDFFLSELSIHSDGSPVKLRNASHSYGKNGLGSGSADAANVIDGEGSTGWSTAEADGKQNRWVANLEKPITGEATIEIELVFERHYAAPLGRMRFSLAGRDSDAVALPIPADWEAYLLNQERDASIENELKRTYFQTSESTKSKYLEIAALNERLPASVRTLIVKERRENFRSTHRHHRGEYLQPKEIVEPAIVEAFSKPTDTKPRNRLEFASWLVSESNPMVGRVTVDRAWHELFGRGIVNTAGDYGTQSEPPTHPELLDHLAVELMSGGWSIKRLHREIVLSAAYRRSSHRNTDAALIDPENRLLATGPRRRLEAERIRDAMLASSGLMVREFGGPSVYPPQPASVTALAYGKSNWTVSSGGNQFRRSVYTFAKRTAPFAAFAVFDGPTGELCIPRRDVSNSPLQSLTLMNDEMFVDIASKLVVDVRRNLPNASNPKIAEVIFRRLLTRRPTKDELQSVVDFFSELPPTTTDDNERWMLVARALMNLDEAITTP